MSWRYVVTKQTSEGEDVFGIKEQYDFEDGGQALTVDFCPAQGGTLQELADDMRYQYQALLRAQRGFIVDEGE